MRATAVSAVLASALCILPARLTAQGTPYRQVVERYRISPNDGVEQLLALSESERTAGIEQALSASGAGAWSWEELAAAVMMHTDAGLYFLSRNEPGVPHQSPTPPRLDYAALVQEYRSGRADEAVSRVAGLEGNTLDDGFRAFMLRTPPADLLTAAAAMHTEVSIRPTRALTEREADHQLAIATAIVELGMPPKGKRLGAAGLRSSVTVSPEFRRLWFLTAITAFESNGRITTAGPYLENARLFFPHDADILLLSGIAEEMRASNRLANASAAERRTSLRNAEIYLRESVALAPGRTEARLRLGRVLTEGGRLEEARPLLTPLTDSPDSRVAYLASLFLGGLEDAAGNIAAAGRWYQQAGARLPDAQAARLAASELQHRAGQHQQAANALVPAIGPANAADPWWSYVFGEHWRVDPYLAEIRKMSRQ